MLENLLAIGNISPPPRPDVSLIWLPVRSCLDMEYEVRGTAAGSILIPGPDTWATAASAETGAARLGTAVEVTRDS